MQSVILLVIFVLTAVGLQFIGFGISRAVNYQWPAISLLTFLVLFLGAFFIAWPIAIRVAEWLLVRMGFILDTEQSGAAGRAAEAAAHRDRLAAGVTVVRVGLATDDLVGKPAKVRTQEERERRVYRAVAATMMAGLLTYGISLMVIQNYNQKKRVGLPDSIFARTMVAANASVAHA